MESEYPTQYSKRIQVSRARDELSSSVIRYWEQRRMRFTQRNGERLHARRGTLLGNLFAIDPGAVRAELSVELEEKDACSCILTIDPRFQEIVDWNRAYWELELETLESSLLTGDLREAEWVWLRRANRAAFWRHVRSGTDEHSHLPSALKGWPRTRHPEFDWGAA
jgi:hypothetical protein